LELDESSAMTASGLKNSEILMTLGAAIIPGIE
jgi:hypothetical protein